MEMEFFVPPADSATWYDYWCSTRMQWYIDLGIPAEMLRLRAHDADELSHYSSGTSDIEFKFPWGWGELEGIAQRTDFDLNRHAEFSKQKLDYFDQATNERYVPYVVEPAAGANRTMAAFLLAAYDEDVINDEPRTVLRLHPRLAPYQVAILPLSKKDTLTPLADSIFSRLSKRYFCDYDETQAIGRRYRRQDEIGTPYCITVDFDSLEDGQVTVRPIAGTRRRGENAEADLLLEKEMLADPKEIAEHLMLIDLGRNDVGRISQTGTVEVTEKMVVERYSHVMHITSNVVGQVKDDMGALEVLKATLPAGTLSGAPKIRAMEIIDELEPVKRNIYGGAVGYIGWDGNMDTAIAIRTAVIKDGMLHVQSGGGVVADSVPELEWEETMNKARAVMRAAAMVCGASK